MSFQDGADDVKIIGGPINFFEEYETTTLYVARALGGQCHSLTITNDSLTDTISVSFDGATLEADIKPGESLTMHTTAKTAVYIKGDAGGDNVRLWGW